jgi:TolB-like protein/tRNA A-37 threonylcarbamoyl transferase component Bud32/Tfp pilus assembly protein PilF
MTTRWGEVVALFERALEQPVAERNLFLDAETQHDPETREQVAAMLRADATPSDLFDSAPERLASVLAREPAPTREGQKIGPYVLVSEIGRGGAATVYVAKDAKHHRSVALKLLNPDTSSALGGDRFRREIEVVAQLQHPHILPLHDSGEVDGLLYYVMPLVSGETLRDRIARDGPLPLADVRRIVRDVAAALDYAHRRGVVHRDVKPANILVDDEHAMVADFGIAHRTVDETEALTATGIIIGTPAYMSPEQSTGSSEVDARSDVYALGCVVFEMLTGTPPFRAPTVQGLVMKHLQAPVPSARTLRPEVPPAVDDVLRTALAKDPAARYPATRDLAVALAEALDSLGSSPPMRAAGPSPDAARPAARRRRWLAVAAGIVAVVLAAVAFMLASRQAEPPSIAVLPFTNMSEDRESEYFSDGITEELTGALAQVGHFRVTPRTTAFAHKGRMGDIQGIGRELGVAYIVEGSARRHRDTVRIVAALIDVETGDRLLNATYNRAFESVLALQADLAGEIAERLHRRLLPEDRARIAERHTVSAEAYESYMKGRYFYDQRTAAALAQAEHHFRNALRVDSLYARAHAGLADTYSILAWTGFAAPSALFAQAKQSALRAVALDSTVAEGHLSLGMIHMFHDWDWAAAEREMDRAIALDSTLTSAWFFRAWPPIPAGRHSEALARLQRARRLEPLSLIMNARVATLLAWADRLPEADSAARKTLEIDPTYPVARVQLARTLSLMGRHDDAIAALPPDSVRLGSFEAGIAGFVYARAGQRDRALAAARALEARAYVPAEGVAAIYAGLGDTALALTWLERAVETKGVGLIFLALEPMYDSLRDEPRYRKVVERIGLVQ